MTWAGWDDLEMHPHMGRTGAGAGAAATQRNLPKFFRMLMRDARERKPEATRDSIFAHTGRKRGRIRRRRQERKRKRLEKSNHNVWVNLNLMWQGSKWIVWCTSISLMIMIRFHQFVPRIYAEPIAGSAHQV